MRIKALLTITSLAFACVILVGCTAGPSAGSSDPNSEPTASPTPTTDPGPVELAADEAAERYLRLVCPSNVAAALLQAAFTASEQEFLDGGTPDPAAVKEAAASRVAINRAAIEILDDTYFVWPTNVRDQIPHIRSSYMAELPTLVVIQNALSFEEAYYASWAPATPEQSAAGQEIRYQLALDADTQTSCVGYENGHTVLVAEREDRESKLARE